MGENEDQQNSGLETLTDEELKVLAKAMKKVEAEIFYKVLRRLSAWIGIMLSVLLVGGVVNISSCSSDIKNSTAQKLANDPEIRDKVISKAQENITGVQEKLKKLNEQTAEIERENARATSTFVSDLQQIRFMVERVNGELLKRLPASVNQPPQEGGEKK